MLKASKYEASHKIRFLRVVIDDDVDRMQVYRWRHHSRALLIARRLSLTPHVWYIRSVRFYFLHCVFKEIQVTTAPGFHLFPFRTEKLSPVTPMVLRNSGRVGSRRFRRSLRVESDMGASFVLDIPQIILIFAADNFFINV